VAASLNNLAFVAKAQEQNEMATDLYQQALTIYQQRLGEDNPLTQRCAQTLAELQKI
jgi:hypothetical protein